MEFADAAARNEEVFREVNERIDEGAERHDVEDLCRFTVSVATLPASRSFGSRQASTSESSSSDSGSLLSPDTKRPQSSAWLSATRNTLWSRKSVRRANNFGGITRSSVISIHRQSDSLLSELPGDTSLARSPCVPQQMNHRRSKLASAANDTLVCRQLSVCVSRRSTFLTRRRWSSPMFSISWLF